MDLLDQHGRHESLDIKSLSLGDDGEFKDGGQPYTIELDSDGEPQEPAKQEQKKRGRKSAAKPKSKKAPAKRAQKKKSPAVPRTKKVKAPAPKSLSQQEIESMIEQRIAKQAKQAPPPQPVYQSSYEQMFMPMVQQQEPAYDIYEMYRSLPA
jgi:hypothetical protein